MDREKLQTAKDRAAADSVMAELETDLHRKQVRESILRIGSEFLVAAEEVLEDTEVRKATFVIFFSTAAGIGSLIVRKLLR